MQTKRYPRRAFLGGLPCVFDFDNDVFRDLWQDLNRTPEQFLAYNRYCISDYGPLWPELTV